MATDNNGAPRARALTLDEAFTDWSAALIGPTPNPHDPATEVYTLPVGAELFHGAPHYVDAGAILERPNFFGDWRTASVYHLGNDDGRCIHRFTVIEPIVVLALDSCPNIRALAARRGLWTPTDAFDPVGLAAAFECTEGRRRPLRRSRSSVDRVLIPAVARVPGTAGVAAGRLRSTDPDLAPFHAEIYLVEPRRYLRADRHVACLPRDVFPPADPRERPNGAEAAEVAPKRRRRHR